MRISIILYLVLISHVLVSQSSLSEVKRNIYQNLNSSVHQNYVRLINEGATEELKNEFYAFSNWTEIQVKSKDGGYFVFDSANYHINDDIMLFLENGKLFYIYPEKIHEINVEGRTFTSHKTKNKRPEYYEVLVNGKIQLLKKIDLIKERVFDHPLGINAGQHDNKFIMQSKFYYYNIDRKSLAQVPRKKKDVIKIFTRHKSKMLSFVKENRLGNKSEGDLIQLFSYYNQLKY